MNIKIFIDIHKKIRENFEVKPFSRKLFRKRNFKEIKNSGFVTGCTDIAIIAKQYLDELGIKSQFIDCVKSGDGNKVEGHVYLLIEFNDEKFFFDPVKGLVVFTEKYLQSLWDYYYIASSLNELKSFEELREISKRS